MLQTTALKNDFLEETLTAIFGIEDYFDDELEDVEEEIETDVEMQPSQIEIH